MSRILLLLVISSLLVPTTYQQQLTTAHFDYEIAVTLPEPAENIEGTDLATKVFLPIVNKNYSSGYQIYTDPNLFNAAISGMGTPQIITFNEIDASPLNNSYLGRASFDSNHYGGVNIASPLGSLLYIAPAGLFWNASNSLSVERFPFDPALPKINADSLVVTYSAPCKALGLTLVDNEYGRSDEYIEFVGQNEVVVARTELPENYTSYRAFIGIVTETTPVIKVNIGESPDDYDDVNYDDFICVLN